MRKRILTITLIFLGITALAAATYFGPEVIRNKQAADQKKTAADHEVAQAKAYNDARWKEYVNTWETVKPKINALNSCIATLEAYEKALEPLYREELSKEAQNKGLTVVNRGQKSVVTATFEIIRDVINVLNETVYRIPPPEKSLFSGIFIDERNLSYKNANPTKYESGRIGADQGWGYIKLHLEYVTAAYCPQLGALEVTVSNIPKLCSEFVKYRDSVHFPPEPSSYEFPEQYQIALNEFNATKKIEFESCKNNLSSGANYIF